MTDVWIEHTALKTALGEGVETTFAALLARQTSFTAPLHFDGKGRTLALCHDLDSHTAPGQSRAEALLVSLRQQLPERLPERLYLATTVGAIDLLEKDGSPIETSRALLDSAKRLFSARQAWLVAAACASGQAAITTAAAAIRAGQCSDALVVGCDITSEFVTAGFASLGALAATTPRPYSQDRDGMALGEAAFATAQAAGQGMTLDGAAAYACSIAEGGPPPLPPADSTAVSEHPSTLTRREREVARLIAQGLSNQEIADHLVISLPTVRSHVSHILSKLNLVNRSQAILYALRNHIASLQDETAQPE